MGREGREVFFFGISGMQEIYLQNFPRELNFLARGLGKKRQALLNLAKSTHKGAITKITNESKSREGTQKKDRKL